jgi:S1-C subfamily serine protease
VRRPPARRPRRIAVAVLTGLAACAEDGPSSLPRVVAVAAQPCDTPNRSIGWGVVVNTGLVATAAHTVEGPLRTLSVDGHPARVAVLDARTDLALLAVDLDAEPARITGSSPRDATVALPAGPIEVEILRTGPLVVRDTTDRARYRREVHTFTPGVEDGTSGAPLVDGDGRVLGIVTLDNRGRGVAYAVTGDELSRLVRAADEVLSTHSGPSQGENSCDVGPSGT